MNKPRRYKGFIVFLVLALLGMQASSAHIHLPAHHDHDGSHHAHQARGHAHNLAVHHRDTIDVAHAQDEHNIVELDHECTTPQWSKQDESADILVSTAISYDFSTWLAHTAPVTASGRLYHPPPRSGHRPRAPPPPVF